MPRWQPSLEDYVDIAAYLLGADRTAVTALPRISLAESLTARFLDANGRQWGPPDVETDVGLVERIAAGEASHEDVVEWIRERTRERGD